MSGLLSGLVRQDDPAIDMTTTGRISRIEHRLDEIERAVIAMYKYSFERDPLMPKLAEIEPLLARMKEVKMELGR